MAITDEYLELARAVLGNMHLPAANEHQARKWLPEIRGPLRDMLAAQRKFAESLRRERGLGHPFELLHLALPVGPQGVHFTDGWVDGAWLSERLQGVRVLVGARGGAGCGAAVLPAGGGGVGG